MRTNYFSLVALLVTISLSTSAQNISDIKVSGNRVAFIKAGDSLFVTNLTEGSNSIFIDKGLKKNGNQRLLNWARDNSHLTYEKDSNIYILDLKTQKTKILNTNFRDSLRFSWWMKVKQAAISSQNQIYFSCKIRGQNSEVSPQLFTINTLNGNMRQLTKDTLSVGNVAVSNNGKVLVYAAYTYERGLTPQSVLHLIDTEGNQLVAPKKFNTFFTSFSWSPNDRLLLLSSDKIPPILYRYNKLENTFSPSELPLSGGEVPLGFKNDSCLLYRKNNQTGIINLNTGNRTVLLEAGTYLENNDSSETILYLKESRTQPKTIWKKSILEPKTDKVIKSLAKINPLSKYTCLTQSYTNGAGKSSSAYVYLPTNYRKNGYVHPVLLVPYGVYSDTYPSLDYFLHGKLFTYLEKGYIIIFPNTRGYASENQTDQYGKMQLEDTELFITETQKQLNIDLQRLWLIGHSHGATMVYYYLTHSKLFKGGIAINGAADWIKQSALKSMAGLPLGLGGTPAQFPDKYLDYSPIANVKNLNNPLLIFAGEKDTQIPFDINAISFHQLATKNNKKTRLITFKDEGHLIEQTHNRRILWKEVDDFLGRY